MRRKGFFAHNCWFELEMRHNAVIFGGENMPADIVYLGIALPVRQRQLIARRDKQKTIFLSLTPSECAQPSRVYLLVTAGEPREQLDTRE